VGEVSYKGHRYPAEIIAHCVWLYHRFPLSFREVEELMLVRGVIVSYETVRQWCAKFGPEYACRLPSRKRWNSARMVGMTSPPVVGLVLRREHPGDADMRVSHESIYRDFYMPSRKAFDASMFHRLRSDRSIRRPLGKRSSYGRGQIRNTVSIRERPVEADTREVAGHWGGDLVFGTRTSAVATLVDRATRYAMVVALLDGRKADAVARALIEQMGRLPVHLRRSLTWDRGLEMAHHAAITAALSMPVFFCDPHHPWLNYRPV
jgi:IS30 family transposase